MHFAMNSGANSVFSYVSDLEQVSLQQLTRRMQQDGVIVDTLDSVSPTRQVPIYVYLIRSTASTLWNCELNIGRNW